MLHNLHYAGIIVWSIVTQEEFDKVQRLLVARRHNPKEPSKGNNPRELGSSYLLSGIISCQLCGGKIQPKPAKSGQYAHYTCRTRSTLTEKECDCPPQNSTDFEK